jgi:hypothetical protein
VISGRKGKTIKIDTDIKPIFHPTRKIEKFRNSKRIAINVFTHPPKACTG